MMPLLIKGIMWCHNSCVLFMLPFSWSLRSPQTLPLLQPVAPEPTVGLIPFCFSIMKLLSKCQQTEILLSTFVQGGLLQTLASFFKRILTQVPCPDTSQRAVSRFCCRAGTDRARQLQRSCGFGSERPASARAQRHPLRPAAGEPASPARPRDSVDARRECRVPQRDSQPSTRRPRPRHAFRLAPCRPATRLVSAFSVLVI